MWSLMGSYSISAVQMPEVMYRDQAFISLSLKSLKFTIQAVVALVTRQGLLCAFKHVP